MTAHKEESMEAITGRSDFFANVGRDGHPGAKVKVQPWKTIWTGTQAKQAHADGKMIVACSLRHDYGLRNHFLILGMANILQAPVDSEAIDVELQCHDTHSNALLIPFKSSPHIRYRRDLYSYSHSANLHFKLCRVQV